MGNAVTWTHADTNRFGGSVQVAEFTVTAKSKVEGDTATTRQELVGEVIKWEILSDSLQAQGAIWGYEYQTDLAIGTRDLWLNYTPPGGAVSVVGYPLKNLSSTSANGVLTTPLPQHRPLCARQTVELYGVAEGESAVVRLYVRQ